MNKTEKEFCDGFEIDGVTHSALEAKGEQAVRYALAQGKYGTPDTTDHKTVLAWFALRASRREATTRNTAIAAIILSTIAIIIQIIQWVLSK